MASRTAVKYLKSTVNGLRGASSFSTSTSLASAEGINTKAKRSGDYFPVYVSIGFISMSVGFGLFTVFHQMARCPNVSLKKSRREMVPEVDEPERVAEHGDRFLKQSFFRKIAHIQEFDTQDVMDDPIRGDVFTRPVRLESLKDVGVEVKPN
ncbi:hypothetical protein CASFOL_001143 [Castilleja foliolosa]|uniref:Uncharacterized protein n=1 Tax=Castilleja foliolosa TaxID=1961234 RepID=A0ABD3ENM9_9LAMI